MSMQEHGHHIRFEGGMVVAGLTSKQEHGHLIRIEGGICWG